MKPTTTIDPAIPDNRDEFYNEFYERFSLRHAENPLKLSDKVSKNYLFPTFYGDVTCAQAGFLCSYEKAQQLMLHPKIRPVPMTMGRALVVFSCYEYKKVLNVAPYNEIAMTIPLLVDPGIRVPVLPLLAPVFKNFGFHVFSMPVTSLENQLRGLKIWNLPKVVQEIDVFEKGDDCVTKAYDDSGEVYFELSVPMTGKPKPFDMSTNLYTEMDGRLHQSTTSFKADFSVNMLPRPLFKKNAEPDREYLTIGQGEAAKVLRDLEIEPHPLQLRFTKGMSACFDLPNKDFEPPFSLK